MKTDKKKIVFIGAIILIVAFIAGYSFLVLGREDETENLLHEVTVPMLSDKDVKTFSSKKDAVDAIEDKRERIAPSVYDDRLLDSLGRFDPDLMDKKKQRMVDSIYRMGRIDYSDSSYSAEITPRKKVVPNIRIDTTDREEKGQQGDSLKKMALEQQLFFAVSPQVDALASGNRLEVLVDGEQTVRVNDRLRMRSSADCKINGIPVSKNTILYGIVKFRPNRVVLEVTNIEHRPVKLMAFDLADGLEGIYIRNSVREQAFREVLGDVAEDINIPGVPQVGGIKKVFQRNHRNVKVTVNNNYRLLLISK